MSYAEAEAEAEASLSRSDSVVGFGVFVMFFLRFDDQTPALPRPPPQSLHSTAAAATSTHVLDIYFKPEQRGKVLPCLTALGPCVVGGIRKFRFFGLFLSTTSTHL